MALSKVSTNQIDTAATPTVAEATVTGDLTVDTNTLFVDSTNNEVGIGTTSPTKKLSASIGLNDTDGLALEYSGENKGGILLNPVGGEVRMGALNSTGTYFTSIYANGSERGRFLSGGGLTFNGDTAAANALNDYEEGTFTPTLSSSFYSGTLTIEGFYRKIGSQVFVVCHARATTSISLTSSGSSFISNMPFSMENVGSIGGYYAASWSNAYTGGTFGNGLAAYGNLYSGQTISMGANQTVNVCATYFTTA